MERISFSQYSKAEMFRSQHLNPGMFVIPNPWDAGTTRMLTALGYPALATTGAGLAYTMGKLMAILVVRSPWRGLETVKKLYLNFSNW